MQVKQAEGERQAAEAQYEARLRLAEAESAAASKRSEGERAIKMVDVNVEREKVNVEQARVEVERVSLSNRSEFEEAALSFELEKLRIEADKQVRIAAAEALGNMLSKAQMQIFGDPETMTKMSEQFMRAASLGSATSGLMKNLPPQAIELIEKLGGTIGASLKPAEIEPAKASNGDGKGHAARVDNPDASAEPSPQSLTKIKR
jgi:hypothetical protein